MLLNETADFYLARRVRQPQGAPIGEVFSFLSGLYFRGKLAYAGRFANPGDGVQVITTDRGLLSIDTPITADDLRSFSELAIDIHDRRYRESLERDLHDLSADRSSSSAASPPASISAFFSTSWTSASTIPPPLSAWET